MAEKAVQHRPAKQLSSLASTQLRPAPYATASRFAADPFADSRPQVLAQRRLAETINRSPRVAALRALSDGYNNSSQRATQVPSAYSALLQRRPASASSQNVSGLPDQLNAGVEALSDVSERGTIQAVGNKKYYDFVGYIGKLLDLEGSDIIEFRSADFAERSLRQVDRSQYESYDEDLNMEEDANVDFAERSTDEIDFEDPTVEEDENVDVMERLPDVSEFENPNIDVDKNIYFEDETQSASGSELEYGASNVGAYIINAILPYGEVGRIRDVVNAMVEGLSEEDYGRIAVVLGINAPEGKEDELGQALQLARNMVADWPIAVGFVTSTFDADRPFPYGTMRNQVLHSEETQALTKYFTLMRLHPYISFQDFDTGSRRVGSEEGPHVFHAVDEILAGEPRDADMEGFLNPIRPLMIAGGYRMGPQDELIAATRERLRKKPLKNVSEEQVADRLAGFSGLIAEDMRVRDQYARLDPLLPYAPEPNLFVDATAAAFPSPMTGTPLAFGPGGAEFTEMGKRLTQYAAEELETYYEQQATDIDLETVEGQLLRDAQNNLHPQRGQSFYTSFEDLSVATDLSRLAYGYLNNEQPQSHTNLATVVDRIFGTKAAKSGVSLAKVKEDYQANKRQSELLQSLYVREGGERSEQATKYFKKYNTQLGGLKRQTLSRALQYPFSSTGSFSGLSFGVDPFNVKYFNLQTALQIPFEEQRDIMLRESVQEVAARLGVTEHYEIGHADGSDHNCTIISIFAAAGAPIDRQQARGYRETLDGEFGIGTVGDIDLTPDIARRILDFVTAKTGQRHALWTLEQSPPDEFGEPQQQYDANELANNGSEMPIFIFFAGAHFSPAWHK